MTINRYSSLPIEHNECIRTNAFKVLSDKKMLQQRLYKTKMCNRKNCQVVDCPFAHSRSELRVLKCLFGEKCLYMHSKNKMCKHIHPQETLESYNDRIKKCVVIKKIIIKFFILLYKK